MKIKGDLLAFYKERLDHTLMQLITRDLSSGERTHLQNMVKHWQKKIEEAR